MLKRHWKAALIAVAVCATAIGCTDLNFNCVGICGTTVGHGDFEGVIQAQDLVEATNSCIGMLNCDGGYTPNCSCYLQE